LLTGNDAECINTRRDRQLLHVGPAYPVSCIDACHCVWPTSTTHYDARCYSNVCVIAQRPAINYAPLFCQPE